jgi:prepilin-type N-terminal cleavage/methylation domain-containing protein
MNMKKGFTLLETLVAIAVLTIAIAGPFFAANRALMSANLAGQKLTASYLAQEGLEYIQAMRSNTFLEGAVVGLTPLPGVCPPNPLSAQAFCHFRLDSTLNSSIAGCRGVDATTEADGSTKCALDPQRPMGTDPGESLPVCNGACPALNLAGGAYTLDAGTPTPYTREIQLYENADIIEVVVTVTWQSYGTQTVVARGYLSAWQ